MRGRNLNAAPRKVRRIKKTARIRTAMGSLGNRNFKNVRGRKGRNL